MSKILEIPLSLSPKANPAVNKTFLESLPYYLGDKYVVSVKDDMLVVEGVPASLEAQVTQAALESLAAAQAEHERVEERCLQSFEGEYPLHDGIYESLQKGGAVFPTGFGKVAYSGLLADVFLGLTVFSKSIA